MLRHVAWFNEALVEPAPEGGLRSPDSSVQRRCLVPARQLEELGVECSVFGNLDDADPAQVSRHLQKLETDIVVIGKIAEPTRTALARAAKHMGCYIIADFGYDASLAPDFAKLAEFADQIVVGTAATATQVKKQAGLTALVIPDCDEDAGEPTISATAHLWLDCFRQLKLKPPVSANTNTPQKSEAD